MKCRPLKKSFMHPMRSKTTEFVYRHGAVAGRSVYKDRCEWISCVFCESSSRREDPVYSEWTLTVILQEAYKERERKIGRKWSFMSKSDAQLYSVTGLDPSSYLRSLMVPNKMAGLDSFWTHTTCLLSI